MRKRAQTIPLIFLKCVGGVFLVGIFVVGVTTLLVWPGWSLLFNYELVHAGSSDGDARESASQQPTAPIDKVSEQSNAPRSLGKEDWKTIQEKLVDIKNFGEKAESRTYENKMMTRELVRLVQAVVVATVAIAILFPLTIWLFSRKRILGLSKLSSEMAATLVSVEERQAKLVSVLQELKGEIEYLQINPSPDLKKLVEEAEMYIEQNAAALEKTSRSEQVLKPD